MKKKTFILTLMLMLCSLVFGQEFYFPEVVNNGEYTEPMALTAVISFDGVEQQTDKLELGVFCGDEIRGRIFTKKMYNRYYARVAVFGKRNDYFTFKVYDHNAGKEWNYGCTITIGDSELDYLSYDVDGYGSFANPCVIDFIAPNHWIPNEYGYNSSLFIQAVVKIDGEELSNPNLELGAFCNGECRGSVKTDFTYEYNGVKRYYARMNIYGKSGNVITFRLYDHSSGKELEFMDVNTIDYEADASIGTIISPFVVNFITSPYVAQIGETKYQSFDAALEAAQYGDDIILLTSISLTETAVLSKDINIALNGKTVTGTIELANVGATVTEEQGAVTSVVTNIPDYKVVYEGGMYQVVAKVYVAQVASTKYETLSEAYAAADANNGIVLLSNITLQSAWKIEKAINIALNGKTVAGTIELANVGATVTEEQGAVTSVVTNIPDYKVVYEGGMYQVVAKVYVAQVGETKYETFAEAIAAAQTGETIVLLADITLANAIDITGKTIDINGKNLKGNVIGTIRTNGGLYTTAENFKMIGVGADYYKTTDATVVIANAAITIASGTVELAQSWNTLENQTLTVAEGATFVVPSSMTFELNGTAIVSGTLTVNGQIILANKNATLKAVDGLNVATNIADYKVVYADGTYKVVAKDYVAQVGSTKYEILSEAYAAADANNGIVLLSDITLESAWKIEKAINIALGIYKVNGTIELANVGATVTGAQDAVTSVVTNIADYKVVYADGTYKVVAKDYVAQVGTTKYETLAEAIAAAQTGETIVLLADATLTNAIDITGKTIDINGMNLKGNVVGTIRTNGGLYTTAENYRMIGVNADYYKTADATVVIAANTDITIKAGTVELAQSWNTLENQILTVAQNATFVVPANMTFELNATAIVEGTLTVNGQIILANKNATLTAVAGLNVITNIADHKVVYENGMYKVVAKVYVAQVGTTKYETLAEAIAAVPANQTVTVLKDITLAETLTIAAEKNFTIDLNGKAINVAYQENSTDKHIYAFDNKGALTLANGTINARGIYNYGTLTVNANATINSIDDNGGYGVDNYGTLNVYGTIATTNEDGDTPEDGNYDATPINNRTNATANVFEGSVIANVSNFTYALDNKGTAIIKGGSFSSGHTTVGNSGTMTIEGGSFVCNGSEGVSSHALIAEAGITTIKGGTFNGKDNNNGSNVYASEGATVKIEGGNFLSCYSGSLSGAGTIEVSGGKFFDAVPENRCAAGYIPTQFTDGYYGVKLGSYVAQIGTTKYETLQAAAAAAQDGQTITVLANVETTNVTLPENVTLDLNGKTVKADIIGKILINNGLWVTAQNYKMIGKNADYYATSDAAIVMGANYSIEMLSGIVTLVPNVWYTLDGQNITIKQDATFNIGDGKTFVINGSNVVNEGTVNNAGTIQILAGTVKGNVTGNLQFKGGSYITAEDYNMVGTTSEYYYNTSNAIINIEADGDITIASGDMTLGKSWRTLPGQTVTVAEGATFTVPADMTYQIYGTAIVNGTLTVNGTVELAALEATLKAQEGLTIESGVEGNKVVYENGMYKLTPMNAYFKGGAYARYVASKDREHFSITLGDVYAKQSLVVKVYSGETLLLTTTYRAEDLDNPGVNRYPVISDKLTVNNVVSGKVSGSWLNEYAQGVELTIANVPDKFEVYADGVLKDTYDGTTSELKGFGTKEDLNTYLGFKGVYKAASITNAAGTEYYMTLAEALADVKEGDVLNLHDNATIANPINVTSNLTINGNGKTLTYTGSNRAIDVTAGNFTAENLTIVANGERGINYNVANGNLTLNNVEVKGTSTYALNLPGLSDGAKVVINYSSLTGKIALNVWGENTTITTTNSHFTSVDETEAEDYAAIVFNNDGTTSCAGTTIVMDGGSIIAKDENGNPSTAVSNSAVVNFVEYVNYSVNNATTIVGEIKTPVAIVTYEGQNAFYSCYTFQDAIDEAIETKGSVKLLTNVASSEIITINGEVKIDGNNKTLTSTATRAINVDYKGKVTICNLTIATTNKTERAINVIQKAAELTLNNVTAEGFKYTIFVAGSSVGSTINTIGGKFSGYAAVNITGSGTTFNSNGTELIGINNAQLHESNNYAVIAVNTVPTENVNVNINGGKVIAQTNVNRQFIATVRYAENANITIDAELGLVNGDVLNATIEDIENNGLIVKVRDDYADELYAQGYATSAADANGLVTVLGKAIYEQRQILGAGWNWFSSYIDINGTTGFEKLQTALGTSGLHIKNQHQFVDYNQGWGWNGTLESTSVEEMYMIQTSAEVELVLKGDIVNPAETEITLNNGWTYIGYPVATAMNIEDALENITPNNGDIIKTHGGVAQYYAETKTWYSQSLTSMTPGFGYMYKNNGGEQTLVYPAANTRAEVRANVTAENNRWVPNASAFANNMNIIAVLESNDMMGEFEVAAFVNGEVRGSARPTYVEPIDAYVLFMTIYGEEGEEMTFKYYDIYSDEEHVISNTVAYSDNAVIGSIKEPYMFFANTLGMEENAASALSIYPNPTTTNAAISFETIYDIVEVFNSLGVKVAEYSNVDRIEGMEAAGVYVIRVTNDNAVQNCRLIVK